MSDNWSADKEEWFDQYPDYHPIILEWLYLQGFTAEEVGLLSDFDYQGTHDPNLLPDITIAADRILQAIKNNEKILVFCDYDADGLPGGAVVDAFFKKINFSNYQLQTPDRNVKGFGLKPDHIMAAKDNKVNLILTVDCGSASIEALEVAAENDIDVIVTDHHEIPKIPDSAKPVALVNPMAKSSTYPFNSICGAAVVFKLVQTLIKKGNFGLVAGWEKWLLDLVAIATVGDMMPLRDENRILVHYGLKVLNKTQNYGLRALIDSCGLQRGNITETDVSFRLAPRINAASRMGQGQVALDLLTANDPLEANRLAAELESLNNARKKTVTQMLKKAHKKLQPPEEHDLSVVVVGDAEWLPGMCGLLASRLVEEYGKSSFVWGRGPGQKIKGSCRAAPGDNVYEMMTGVSSDIIESCGGHVGAGGFVLHDAKIHEFAEALDEARNLVLADRGVGNGQKSDAESVSVTEADITNQLLDDIDRLAPFGLGFPRPVVKLKCEIMPKSFGKRGEHLKLRINHNLSAIMWRTTCEEINLVENTTTTVTITGGLEYDPYTKSPRLTVNSIVSE